jgi:hypothetical protein
MTQLIPLDVQVATTAEHSASLVKV